MARRLALLIATDEYEDGRLRRLTSPAHDASALAAVLRDPDIAGFEVTTLVNEPHYRVGEAVGELYRGRRRDDLTLLYFTGHGLKDDDGRLYLAMANTRRDSLLFTSLPAEQVDQAMSACASRRNVLVLDCCYSGAFPAGRTAKSDLEVHALERFQGHGRSVLTASDATQYSFEGEELQSGISQSVFTRHLIAGLRDGSADLDGDGDVTLDELYGYVYDRVVEEMPQQRPKKQDNIEGRIVIARNVNWTLPTYLRNAIKSPIATDRLAALDGLDHLHRVGNERVREQVRAELERLTADDSRMVSSAATERLHAVRPPEPAPEPPTPAPRVPEPPTPEPSASEPPVDRMQEEAPPSAPGPPDLEPSGAEPPAAEPPAPQTPSPVPGTAVRESLWRRRRNVIVAATAVPILLAAAVTITVIVANHGHDANDSANSASGGFARPPARGIAVSPDGRHVYVPTETGLAVADTKTRAAVKSAITVNGQEPAVVATDPDGRRLYLTGLSSGGDVSVLDSKTSIWKTPIEVLGLPTDLAAAPEGHRLYIAHVQSDGVSVADTPSGKVTGQPIIVSAPNGVAASGDGRRLYVTNMSAGTVTVIDTATRKVTGSPISVSGPVDVAVSKNGELLYVPTVNSRAVNVIDVKTAKVVKTIATSDNPGGVAVSPDGRRLYVANWYATSVSIFDTKTYQVVGAPIALPH